MALVLLISEQEKLVRYIRRIRQELAELLDAAPDSDKRSEKCPAGA